MRSFMVSLSGFLTRRRWWVVGAWLITVVIAAPLAAKQTEHLNGGGFDVPGSQSQTVETALTQRFESSEAGRIGVVLQPSPTLTADEAAAALDRTRSQVAAAGHGASIPRSAMAPAAMYPALE